MDFPKWARDDGEKLANLIYEKLKEKEVLGDNEVYNVYDNCGFPIFRKTEGVAWGILNPKIERFKDENNKTFFRLKE